MLAVIRSPKIASDNLCQVSSTARVLGSDKRQVREVGAGAELIPLVPIVRPCFFFLQIVARGSRIEH